MGPRRWTMYEADGINLTKSQYDALCHLVELGGEADSETLDKARSSLSEKIVYAELENKRLVHLSHDPDGRLLGINVRKRNADDWFAAYEESKRAKHAITRHDWLVAAMTALLTAALTAVVQVLAHHIGLS